MLDRTKMAISRATRTHFVYQFIILTLLFLGIGYNELLPDRKFVLFLAFMPIFCYQIIILLCFLELVALPQWLSFSGPTTQKVTKAEIDVGTQSSPIVSSHVSSSMAVSENSDQDFLDASDKLYTSRRWEKSAMCLQKSPKDLDRPQKSKSWVNLSDSRRKLVESLPREGSLEVIAPLAETRLRSAVKLSKADKASYRDKRANKAKSWKPGTEYDFASKYKLDFQTSKQKIEDIESSLQKSDFMQQTKTENKETQNEQPRKPELGSCAPVHQDESELNKSYSFPFRQKRLESWLEMKETETRDSNQSLNMPYWQTVGYNLAVKYEARRRRRAVSTPATYNIPTETHQESAFQNSVELPADSTSSTKLAQKKVKSASACISKIKIGFSNLISKVKEEISESSHSKTSKPAVCSKTKAKIPNTKLKESELTMPEFPQFLSNERPLIFYPKYIPFEKERFEGDVQKKILELANEKDQNFKL